MTRNPDIYLLYEYVDKVPYTVRMKVYLDAPVDAALLAQAAQEAIGRLPYFSVRVGLDPKQNYTLEHNHQPIAVLPEKDECLTLGSEAVHGHLVAITYRDECIWFDFSHTLCSGMGALFWVKATLFQYLTKQHRILEAPKDLKLPGTPVKDGELFFPDADKLPRIEPTSRHEGGDSSVQMGRILKYMLNPFAKDCYYYETQIPVREFMEYAAGIDGSPNSILTAMMLKVTSRIFKERKGTFLSGKFADDYRNDIGAGESYHDFVRFIHVKYEWSMKNESIRKLSMRARRAIIAQSQPELSHEWFRKLTQNHASIDEQPNLKAKKKYAARHRTFSRPRDTYVGQVDWGGMEKHIKGSYSITDGDLMIELNALKDTFCLSFELLDKNREPLELFCELLAQEGIPYCVSERHMRHMPRIKLPSQGCLA
ncbi:MAG: hypothetical protein IKG18_02115 [Atopobiaceae bacterium]|nr:hypothetical protein [Atopobiaceae bacterium]